MPLLSAGLLVYHFTEERVLEVLIVHPGGPFWSRKDSGAWSIPKGEYTQGEDAEATALREFQEELGKPPPSGPRTFLGEIQQRSGKRLSVWATQGDLDVSKIVSNEFELEWPRGSGKIAMFPEVDRASWFSSARARTKLLPGHVEFLERLVAEVRRSEVSDFSESGPPDSAGQQSMF